MDWENHNEWLELARIAAPILAAAIAAVVALCVLSRNMKLGRANLKMAIRNSEKNINAAEKRERENWQREKTAEYAAVVLSTTREYSQLVPSLTESMVSYQLLNDEETYIPVADSYKVLVKLETSIHVLNFAAQDEPRKKAQLLLDSANKVHEDLREFSKRNAIEDQLPSALKDHSLPLKVRNQAVESKAIEIARRIDERAEGLNLLAADLSLAVRRALTDSGPLITTDAPKRSADRTEEQPEPSSPPAELSPEPGAWRPPWGLGARSRRRLRPLGSSRRRGRR